MDFKAILAIKRAALRASRPKRKLRVPVSSLTMEEAVNAKITFDDYADAKNVPQDVRRSFQLRWEATIAILQCEPEKRQKLIVTDRNGWPKDRTTFQVHNTRQEAAAAGIQDFGKGNFLIKPFRHFQRSSQAKYLQRLWKVKAKLNLFKKVPVVAPPSVPATAKSGLYVVFNNGHWYRAKSKHQQTFYRKNADKLTLKEAQRVVVRLGLRKTDIELADR